MGATPLWFTPQQIKERIGDPNQVDTKTVILAEIYNQQYNSGSIIIANASNMLVVPGDFNPSNEYTNAALVGKIAGETMLVYVNVGSGIAAMVRW